VSGKFILHPEAESSDVLLRDFVSGISFSSQILA